jgi:hypothetical protein
MPFDKNASTAEKFHDLRHGKQFARTSKKHGRKKALKQMQAIALGGRGKKGRKKKARSSGR